MAHIGDVVDPATRTVKIRCAVPNPDGHLKPEMFARIDTMSSNSQALFLPSTSVLNDTDQPQVIVGAEGKVFRQRPVTLGPEVDGHVRVVRGLKPGEQVVTSGALFLKAEMEDR